MRRREAFWKQSAVPLDFDDHAMLDVTFVRGVADAGRSAVSVSAGY